jgi:hypothetical protein
MGWAVKQGTVDIVSGQFSELNADFKDQSGSIGESCSRTTVASCDVLICQLTNVPKQSLASAGTLSLTGVMMPITLSPDASNSYASNPTTGPNWKAGDMLTLGGSGATVPAFSTQLVAPSYVDVTTPALTGTKQAIDRTKDLAFAWTGGGAGSVVVSFSEVSQTPDAVYHPISVTCTFPAASGAGSVPASVLAQLSASGGGVLEVDGRTIQTLAVKDWQIVVTATATSTWSGSKITSTSYSSIN